MLLFNFILLVPSVFAVEKPVIKTFYKAGDPLEVSCLNRTADTGEHISDSHGTLQYIPFPVCNETQTPLTLNYLSETPLTCTITELSEDFFHLLELYVHADSPLTCRIPRRPLGNHHSLTNGGSASSSLASVEGGQEWTPLVISIAGKFEISHLHIANHVNMLFHVSSSTGNPEFREGDEDLSIDSATAYSTSPLHAAQTTKVIIGDPLPLYFTPRWYATSHPPRGTYLQGRNAKLVHPRTFRKGEHVTVHTIMYCVLSCIATAAVCAVYFRGWEFPKRLRRWEGERRGGGGGAGAGGMGGSGGSSAGNGFSSYGGYGGYGGYGVGIGGNGGPVYGKKD
ncbi:hypothetical protein DFH27DRAFT_487785 [Peziza echinospora]|nr:hypothetical protein DFH27DRAFT_487785 [Peziza echinospora]